MTATPNEYGAEVMRPGIDPTTAALQMVRKDFAELRREWRQDIRDLRAEMVTRDAHAAAEVAHAQEHTAIRKSAEQEHKAIRGEIAEVKADVDRPHRWPGIVGGISAIIASASVVITLLAS